MLSGFRTFETNELSSGEYNKHLKDAMERRLAYNVVQNGTLGRRGYIAKGLF